MQKLDLIIAFIGDVSQLAIRADGDAVRSGAAGQRDTYYFFIFHYIEYADGIIIGIGDVGGTSCGRELVRL